MMSKKNTKISLLIFVSFYLDNKAARYYYSTEIKLKVRKIIRLVIFFLAAPFCASNFLYLLSIYNKNLHTAQSNFGKEKQD